MQRHFFQVLYNKFMGGAAPNGRPQDSEIALVRSRISFIVGNPSEMESRNWSGFLLQGRSR